MRTLASGRDQGVTAPSSSPLAGAVSRQTAAYRTMGPMSTPDVTPPGAGHWRLVLPIKGTPDAKSRLSVPVGIGRATLARAMALDTLQAALDCRQVGLVLVVTSDRSVAEAAEAAGALVEPDPGSGLNDAVRRGVDRLGGQGDGPVGVLLADLPALRPADLAAALLAASAHQVAYVPDAEGTGTVLLAATSAPSLQPEFGDGSAGRHERGGAVRLELDRPRLRRDVDVQSSLGEALRLGVGQRTAAALADIDQRWLA
jgi:2-phospho-L-lactate guanylyltransferase